MGTKNPPPGAAIALTGDLFLTPWQTSCRVTRSLIANLPPDIWTQCIPGMPRKTIRMLAAHLHNARGGSDPDAWDALGNSSTA